MPEKKTIQFERIGEVTTDYYGQHKFQKSKEGEWMRAPDVGFDFVDHLTNHMEHMLSSVDDQILMITGHERSGKSTLGQILARILDSDLALDDIIFPRGKIVERIRQADEEDTILIDEAGAALFSQEWMEKEQRSLVKAFQQFGIKRMKVLLILPHRMLLNKQIRERRIDWWFHCYKTFEPTRIRRGFARLRYPDRNEWSVTSNWKPLAHFRFPKLEDEFWKKYEEKKRDHVNNHLMDDDEGKMESKYKARVYKAVDEAYNEENKTQAEIGDMFGYSRSQVANIISELKEKPKLAEVEN